MKILKLDDIKDSICDDFSIIDNYGNLRLKYKNEEFIIDTETQFKNCDIFIQKNIPKIKMTFNNDHDKLLETINLLCDKIGDFIEKNDDINISHIINPIYKSGNIKMLFSTINKKTIIKNIDNDENMELEELNNNFFNVYPILYCLSIKIYNENLYINFSFHTVFIKLIKEKGIDINYDKIKEFMNK